MPDFIRASGRWPQTIEVLRIKPAPGNLDFTHLDPALLRFRADSDTMGGVFRPLPECIGSACDSCHDATSCIDRIGELAPVELNDQFARTRNGLRLHSARLPV